MQVQQTTGHSFFLDEYSLISFGGSLLKGSASLHLLE